MRRRVPPKTAPRGAIASTASACGCRVSRGVVRRVYDDLGMGQRFVVCDREQSFPMPPDVRESLPANHLAWFVIDAVEEMDLVAFYSAPDLASASEP